MHTTYHCCENTIKYYLSSKKNIYCNMCIYGDLLDNIFSHLGSIIKHVCLFFTKVLFKPFLPGNRHKPRNLRN